MPKKKTGRKSKKNMAAKRRSSTVTELNIDRLCDRRSFDERASTSGPLHESLLVIRTCIRRDYSVGSLAFEQSQSHLAASHPSQLGCIGVALSHRQFRSSSNNKGPIPGTPHGRARHCCVRVARCTAQAPVICWQGVTGGPGHLIQASRFRSSFPGWVCRPSEAGPANSLAWVLACLPRPLKKGGLTSSPRLDPSEPS